MQAQAFIQNSPREGLILLEEFEELELLNAVLSKLLEIYCNNADKRDGLAKVIGLLWQDELKRMIEK